MERSFSLEEIIILAGTRVALGAGIGMLASRDLDKHARKATGLALIAVGAFTTIPLVLRMMGKSSVRRPEIRAAA
jgi:hypothetical protein